MYNVPNVRWDGPVVTQEKGLVNRPISPHLRGDFFNCQDSQRNPLIYLLSYHLTKKFDNGPVAVLKNYQPSDSLKNQARLEVVVTRMKSYPSATAVECEDDLRELLREAVLIAPIEDQEANWRLLPYAIRVYRLYLAENWLEEFEATREEVGV